jgi:hypothetical protein
MRELEPITTELLNENVLFEGVTAEVDDSRRFARKVKADDLETFFARGASRLATKENVADAVAVETERAQEAEEVLQDALDAETGRAALAENILTRDKADKITVPKTLSDAAVGDKLGVVVFDRTQTPTVFVAGNITLQNNAEYALTDAGVFTFTSSAGVTQEIYSPENGWGAASIDTGDSPVTAEANAESGIWSLCLWAAETASLQDIKNIADEARTFGAQALSTANNADDKADAAVAQNAVQDGRLTDIETKNAEQDATATIDGTETAGTFGAVTDADPLALKSYVDEFIDTSELDTAIADHNTDDTAHADIREQVNGLATQQGNWLGQNFPTYADLEAFEQNRPAGFETIPDKTWTRVYDDENHADALTVYAWFNNTLAYQYTMAFDQRNFETDPIQTAEIADAAVTSSKIKQFQIQFTHMMDLVPSPIPFTPDTTDFGNTVSGTFTSVFTSIIQKIKGLFALMATAVKKTGDEEIAGVKTFTTAPVIPSATALPDTPSGTKPATEMQVKNALASVSGTFVRYGLGKVAGNGGDWQVGGDQAAKPEKTKWLRLAKFSNTHLGWEARLNFDIFYAQNALGGGVGNGRFNGKCSMRLNLDGNPDSLISEVSLPAGYPADGALYISRKRIEDGDSENSFTIWALCAPGATDSNMLYCDLRSLFGFVVNNDDASDWEYIFYAAKTYYANMAQMENCLTGLAAFSADTGCAPDYDYAGSNDIDQNKRAQRIA